MGRYVARRLLQAIPLLVGISILAFALLQMTPGGPLAVSEAPGRSGRATAEQMAKLRNRYGLDDPIPVQYLNWAGGLLRGDWGISFNTGRPVLLTIAERVPTTLLLTGLAFAVALLLALPIGIVAAIRQYSVFDYLSTGVAFLGIAIPSFWLALMLLFVFTYTLGWLPSVGLTDPRQTHEGLAALADRARHLVMPVAVLALASTAGMTRYVRAAMIETGGQDFVRTARAKGLRERTVVIGHALKNAAIPIVTVVALEIPDLFIGAVIVESVFAISGMGRLFVESANLRDYPVLMGILMIASLLVVASNLIADVVYGWLDPRISYK
jgi:peptide/nickel transport system permease protein